jgi:hypothetical protein
MSKEDEKTLLQNIPREATKTENKEVRSTETSAYLGNHLQIFRWWGDLRQQNKKKNKRQNLGMRVQRGNFSSVCCPSCSFFTICCTLCSLLEIRKNRAHDVIPRNRNVFLFQARFHLVRIRIS